MARLIILALAVVPLGARAGADSDAMRASMHAYFDGEVRGAYGFGAAGLLAAAGGAYALTRDDPLARGFAIPVLTIGAVELAAATLLLLRTSGQVRDLEARLDTDPEGFRDAERARMERVHAGFTVYTLVEMFLFAAGGVTAGFGAVTRSRFALGVGLGLSLQSLVMLLLDHFAETRAAAYLSSLERFEVSVGLGALVVRVRY